VSGGCKCRSTPLDSANSAPQIPQLDFRGHFAEERGKGKEKRGKENQESDGRVGENIPAEINLWSRPWHKRPFR